MGDTDGLLTYRQLIGEVRRFCAQRQTGCVFIKTSDNHGVRFTLQNGTIVAVGFRNQTGLEALASVQRIRKGRVSFSDGLPPQDPQPGLPSTADLLAQLERADSGVADGDEPKAGPGPVNEALVQSRAIIEAELVEYLGPMARVVFGEQIASASNLTQLIETLAGEFKDPAKFAQFKERVRERLAPFASGSNGASPA
jgi:hypothetical protein